MLHFVNGDVRRTRIIHYERACGRCRDRREAALNMEAALLDAGILPPCGAIEPSKSRWGQVDEALAQQAPGILIHNISGRSQKIAFPQWGAMVGANSEEEEADYRRWVASKIFRSTKCLSDSVWQSRMLATMWAGRPVYHLWRRLEYLDAQGCALLDVICPNSSPFLATQRKLTQMLTLPPQATPLATLMYHFEDKPAEMDAV